MQPVTITLTPEEALLVVTALGCYQNRVGQQARHDETRRLPDLIARRDAAERDGERDGYNAAIDRVRTYVSHCVASGKTACELKDRIKSLAGITDERRHQRQDAAEPVTE